MVPINRRLWRAVYCMTDLFLTPFFKLNVGGTHHIPSCRGCILLPKHQRWQDIPLLGLAAGRPLYYVAKYELFQNSSIRQLLLALGGIPLNREQPLNTRKSFRACVEALAQGEGLTLFPEGTYFQNRMGQGRSGMLRYILNRVSVPLIPVGIQYRRLGWREEVFIRFGAPIKDTQDPAVLSQVMIRIAELSGL